MPRGASSEPSGDQGRYDGLAPVVAGGVWWPRPATPSLTRTSPPLLAIAARARALVVALAVGACGDGTGLLGPAEPPGRPDRTAGDWAAVSVNQHRTCALDRAGRASCWGNGFGTTPLPVPGGTGPFAAVTVGYDHQCLLAATGQAFCWGANDRGQLGTGTVAPPGERGVTTPQAVAGGLAFTALSAGRYHTCGLTADGAAYCWGGAGRTGALGTGAPPPGCDPGDLTFCAVPAPAPVAGGHRFAQVSAGSGFTCGVTTAGAALCWGDNHLGALGAPDVPVGCEAAASRAACVRDGPVAVAGELRFLQVAAGLHACAVTTAGAAYCWGLVTDDAALGAAELGNAPYTGYFGAQRGSRVPVPVEGGLRFRAVSAGGRGSCGLTTDGRAVCWGSNNFAQMGVGGIRPVYSTTPRAVWMPAAAAAPAVGEGYHACAPTTSGRLWCWGDSNFFGELGSDPVRVFLRATPTPVGGSDPTAR